MKVLYIILILDLLSLKCICNNYKDTIRLDYIEFSNIANKKGIYLIKDIFEQNYKCIEYNDEGQIVKSRNYLSDLNTVDSVLSLNQIYNEILDSSIIEPLAKYYCETYEEPYFFSSNDEIIYVSFLLDTNGKLLKTTILSEFPNKIESKPTWTIHSGKNIYFKSKDIELNYRYIEYIIKISSKCYYVPIIEKSDSFTKRKKRRERT